MTLRKVHERGFSLILVVSIVFSVLGILAALLSYSVRSYKLEKAKQEKLRLYFLARSAVSLTVESMLEWDKKGFTDKLDIEAVSKEFLLDGQMCRVKVLDENAKLNTRLAKINPEGTMSSLLSEKAKNILEAIDDPKKVQKLEEIFTEYGNGSINLNTSHPEILQIFFKSREEMNQFLALREKKSVETLSEAEYIRQEKMKPVFPLKGIQFSSKSSCFSIIATAKGRKQAVTVKEVLEIVDGGSKKIFFEEIK